MLWYRENNKKIKCEDVVLHLALRIPEHLIEYFAKEKFKENYDKAKLEYTDHQLQ